MDLLDEFDDGKSHSNADVIANKYKLVVVWYIYK